MAQKGAIPASKLGNQWHFDRDEVDAWMKQQRPNKPGSGEDWARAIPDVDPSVVDSELFDTYVAIQRIW